MVKGGKPALGSIWGDKPKGSSMADNAKPDFELGSEAYHEEFVFIRWQIKVMLCRLAKAGDQPGLNVFKVMLDGCKVWGQNLMDNREALVAKKCADVWEYLEEGKGGSLNG
jgi:hypothetical protein